LSFLKVIIATLLKNKKDTKGYRTRGGAPLRISLLFVNKRCTLIRYSLFFAAVN